MADLNYDNADMCLAMIDAMKYWIQEVGVDGFAVMLLIMFHILSGSKLLIL